MLLPLVLPLTLFGALVRAEDAGDLAPSATRCGQDVQRVEDLVRRWAPLIWLAPGERYFPGSVSEFLKHVTPRKNGGRYTRGELPGNRASEFLYLVTNRPVESLLVEAGSVLHGRNPASGAVPVYAAVRTCASASRNTVRDPEPAFHVTYWLFFPYNLGKSVCTLDAGLLGSWPLLEISGRCLGTLQQYGNHVGDWEHVSIRFRSGGVPESMYVSTHDVGAYYRFDARARSFSFEKDNIWGGRGLQRPKFPSHVNLTSDGKHPVLFAALGSHGLWSVPGKHVYVKVPPLRDETGFGVRWATWNNIQVLDLECDAHLPDWMRFRGRWGNPKRGCHPVIRLGISVCEYSDGPTGIPMKKSDFKC